MDNSKNLLFQQSLFRQQQYISRILKQNFTSDVKYNEKTNKLSINEDVLDIKIRHLEPEDLDENIEGKIIVGGAKIDGEDGHFDHLNVWKTVDELVSENLTNLNTNVIHRTVDEIDVPLEDILDDIEERLIQLESDIGTLQDSVNDIIDDVSDNTNAISTINGILNPDSNVYYILSTNNDGTTTSLMRFSLNHIDDSLITYAKLNISDFDIPITKLAKNYSNSFIIENSSTISNLQPGNYKIIVTNNVGTIGTLTWGSDSGKFLRNDLTWQNQEGILPSNPNFHAYLRFNNTSNIVEWKQISDLNSETFDLGSLHIYNANSSKLAAFNSSGYLTHVSDIDSYLSTKEITYSKIGNGISTRNVAVFDTSGQLNYTRDIDAYLDNLSISGARIDNNVLAHRSKYINYQSYSDVGYTYYNYLHSACSTSSPYFWCGFGSGYCSPTPGSTLNFAIMCGYTSNYGHIGCCLFYNKYHANHHVCACDYDKKLCR